MAIQYAGGTNVNTTFTCTTGTRREIVDGLVAALNTAGWTTVSGGGTGDVLLASATTPQGLSIRCRVYDAGSGNCTRFQMRNAAGSKVSQDFFLAPAAARVYRVIANKYQWFCFVPTVPNAGREFGAMGVPWIPSFLEGVITGDCGWANNNAWSDGDTTNRYSLRTMLAGHEKGSGLVNSSLCEWSGVTLNAGIRLLSLIGGWTDQPASGYRWHDLSLFVCEPLISWGTQNTGDEALIRGQLWDAVIVGQAFAAGETISLDGKTWYAITGSNTGGSATARGTLFALIP